MLGTFCLAFAAFDAGICLDGKGGIFLFGLTFLGPFLIQQSKHF